MSPIVISSSGRSRAKASSASCRLPRVLAIRGSTGRLWHSQRPVRRGASYRGRVQCGYFDRGECRSCTLMGLEYELQLDRKLTDARHRLAAWPDAEWLPAM